MSEREMLTASSNRQCDHWWLVFLFSFSHNDLEVAAVTGSCIRDTRASVSELSRPFLQGSEVIFYLQFQASRSSRTKAE